MKNRNSSWRLLWTGVLAVVWGGVMAPAQVQPSEPGGQQGSVVSIGVLNLRDESGSGEAGLAEKLTQQLRQRFFMAYPDVLPKMLGQEAGADPNRGMTLEELSALGRQFGVRLVLRSGIMPANVEAAGEQTKVTVWFYAEIASLETGEVRSVRAEGSGAHGGSSAEIGWAAVDFGNAEFVGSALGQALSSGLDQLVAVVHQEVVALTAGSTPQPTSEVPVAEAVPVEGAEMPESVDPAAQAAAEDQELQQLIVDAESVMAAGSAADPEMLNRVSRALEDLRGALALKADQLQRGENLVETDLILSQKKEELRSAVAAIMDSGLVTPSEVPSDQPGQSQGILTTANTYASEALSLIQKIMDLRTMLWGAQEETYLVGGEESSPEASEEPVEEVTGVVVEDGEPVEGAEVVDTESGATAETDSDGSYLLRPIPAGILSNIQVRKKLKVLAIGRLPVVRGGLNVADFPLTKSARGTTGIGVISSKALVRNGKKSGGILKGKVEDASGRPVCRVLVHLAGVGMLRTNSLGEYAFINVPPGAHQLKVHQIGKPSQVAKAQVKTGTVSLATIKLATDVGARRDTGQPLLLVGSTGAVLHGRVRDNRNKALPGARISAVRGSVAVRAMTGREGKYELRNLSPGAYRLVITKAGFQSAGRDVNLKASEREECDFSMKQTSALVDQMRKTSLAKQGTLRGQIRGSDAKPVGGVLVEARAIGRNLPPFQARTGADGSYLLNIGEGRYEVWARKSPFQPVSRVVSIRAGDATKEDFSLRRLAVTMGPGPTKTGGQTVGAIQGAAPASRTASLGAGQLAGRVTGVDSGRALAGARVLVDGRAAGQTDGDGQYAVAGLSTGDHRVSVQQDGYVSQESRVVMRAGGSIRADFRLIPVKQASVAAGRASSTLGAATAVLRGGRVQGRVVDSRTGQGIAGASVSLAGAATVATDRSGGYLLSNVPPGRYQLSVSKSGYLAQQRTVTVASGQTLGVNLSLAPSQRLMIPSKR